MRSPMDAGFSLLTLFKNLVPPAVLLIAAPASLFAQQPPDSLAAVPDTTRLDWPSSFTYSLSRSIPARSYAFELTEMLRDEPASFLYDLGAHGWPHGWSPSGIAPQHVRLLWNSLPLDDPLTGRPLFNLLPLESTGVPQLRLGASVPASISLGTREDYLQSPAPLTELSYQTSNNGLQKVSALHTQNRRLSVSGNPGVLNVLFAYGGEAADGEYPGSRVEQGRRLYGRLRYTLPSWTIEGGDLYNKRAVGAHAGVIPFVSGNFDSIYQRLGASVIDPDARRSIRRNDVFLTIRFDPGRTGRSITDLTASYASQRTEYRRPGDTLTVRTKGLYARLSQAFVRPTYRIGVDVSASLNSAGPRSADLAFDETTDSRLAAAGELEIRLGDFTAAGRIGVESRKEGSRLTGRGALRQRLGPASLQLEISQLTSTVSLIDRTGLGAYVQAAGAVPMGSTRMVRASATLAGGGLDLSVIGTLTDQSEWIDYFGTSNPDSVVALVSARNLRLAAAGIDFGIRREAGRGVYLTVQPTLFDVLQTGTSALRQYGAALPDLYAVARLGIRYRLFRGDLDLDLSVRGRYWSEFTGRRLHTQTGLLIIPTAATRPVESSATLDIIAEGGVRTATLFLAYENILAGTTFLPGNLLVPVYPLPEKRLRFGVFWPIRN